MAVFHGLSAGKIAQPWIVAPGPALPPGTPPTTPASDVDPPLLELLEELLPDELPPLLEPPPDEELELALPPLDPLALLPAAPLELLELEPLDDAEPLPPPLDPLELPEPPVVSSPPSVPGDVSPLLPQPAGPASEAAAARARAPSDTRFLRRAMREPPQGPPSNRRCPLFKVRARRSPWEVRTRRARGT
jgi:hypothetical protein